MKTARVALLACLFTAVASSTVWAQTFEIIPGISGESIKGVSADGSVIVGIDGGAGWVWDQVNGRRDLPVVPGYARTSVYGVSADGNWLAARPFRETSPLAQAARFNVSTWTFELAGLWNGNSTTTFGISPDGQTLATDIVVTPGAYSAGRWRPGNPIQLLHENPQFTVATTTDVSNSGSTVGYNFTAGGESAYHSSDAGGFQFLPTLDNSTSRAQAISADDHVIVGSIGNRAAAWVESNPLLFDALPGFARMVAQVTDEDGSVIGGADALASQGATKAWIWTAESGTMSLDVFLAGKGVTVTEPTEAFWGITPDRLTIIGVTTANQVFRATLAEPLPSRPIPGPGVFAIVGVGAGAGARRRRR